MAARLGSNPEKRIVPKSFAHDVPQLLDSAPGRCVRHAVWKPQHFGTRAKICARRFRDSRPPGPKADSAGRRIGLFSMYSTSCSCGLRVEVFGTALNPEALGSYDFDYNRSLLAAHNFASRGLPTMSVPLTIAVMDAIDREAVT
jgi:hypothetical protein